MMIKWKITISTAEAVMLERDIGSGVSSFKGYYNNKYVYLASASVGLSQNKIFLSQNRNFHSKSLYYEHLNL